MTIQHTSRFGFPYPQRVDTSDVPRDIGALATALETLLNQLIPIGALHMWSAAAAPSGWLICDGSPYSRTSPTYSALFAVISTTYGAGDGSTTFNVPDLRGRTIVGAGAGAGLTARSLGSYGGGTLDTNVPKLGEEAHQILATEMPAHDHGGGGTVSGNTGPESDTHYHGANTSDVDPFGGNAVAVAPAINAPIISGRAQNGTGTFTSYFPRLTADDNQWGGGGGNGTHHHSITTGTEINPGSSNQHHHSFSGGYSIPSNGGGGSHNNMQPYIVTNYIIRYQ